MKIVQAAAVARMATNLERYGAQPTIVAALRREAVAAILPPICRGA